uniref:Uncharacterized protein n=1 Tax=Corethron hystrix TaxID=216773 RepID=A0A6U5DUZ7_9STRA|mmetsp:Transcript_14202/g.31059  ORF Transcript_14202/g.31059 Transcript_14202/m.31059 type:complete len:114 (+) Transcript_14202:72-413(+)
MLIFLKEDAISLVNGSQGTDHDHVSMTTTAIKRTPHDARCDGDDNQKDEKGWRAPAEPAARSWRKSVLLLGAAAVDVARDLDVQRRHVVRRETGRNVVSEAKRGEARAHPATM